MQPKHMGLDSEDNKNQQLDIYTPLNTQKYTNRIEILRPYPGFELPEFYQGPQWKFVRQSTNQNSKQKHYEKGEYDNVQYNFQDADKGTDGEQKLYPPIQDFSDEDVGIAPSSTHIKAKVSYSTKKTPVPESPS